MSIIVWPVLDWRSGFLFSLLNEQQDFVGSRNDGGRFPSLVTLDLLVTKGLMISFRGRKYKGRAGLTLFNITNHWEPAQRAPQPRERTVWHVLQQPRSMRAAEV